MLLHCLFIDLQDNVLTTSRNFNGTLLIINPKKEEGNSQLVTKHE
jgi:hypothetical protein